MRSCPTACARSRRVITYVVGRLNVKIRKSLPDFHVCQRFAYPDLRAGARHSGHSDPSGIARRVRGIGSASSDAR